MTPNLFERIGSCRASPDQSTFICLALLATSLACPPHAARRTTPRLRLLVTRSLGDDAMLRAASAVAAERSTGDCLWLVAGSGLRGTAAEVLTEGSAAAERLDALGVNAALLGPDWLAYGPARARMLAERARCFLLAANITDSEREPLGSGFIVRPTPVGVIGISGVWTDSADALFDLAGVRYSDPRYAAAAVLPILRQRCDVLILLTSGTTGEQVAGWDIQLDGAQDSVLLFELSLFNGALRARRMPIVLELFVPEPRLAHELTAIAAAGESSIAVARPLDSGTTEQTIVQSFLDQCHADYLATQSALWRGGDIVAALARSELVLGLSNPGRWVLTTLTTQQRDALARQTSLRVLRSKTASARSNAAQPTLMLSQHASVAKRRFGASMELTPVPLWRAAEIALTRAGQAK